MVLLRTDASHPDFVHLVKELDAELTIRDEDEHDFYHQFNGIDNIHHVILAYIDNAPVACGAIKHYDDQRIEVKRMFVLPTFRGHGYALQVLSALENWAKTLGYTHCILETGMKQPEAIRLYTKSHYEKVDNYGQYADIENSLCFQKSL